MQILQTYIRTINKLGSHEFAMVTLQGKFRFWDSKFREMKNRSVESVEKDRRLFHPSHSQNDDGDDE